MNSSAMVKFRLYVAGDARNSTTALSNLSAFCSEYLPNLHEIEVIDVTRNQTRALDDGILMTPTLIKLFPLPVRKIVGSLGQKDVLLSTLGLERPST
jgi:circadian clock protein KaiB